MCLRVYCLTVGSKYSAFKQCLGATVVKIWKIKAKKPVIEKGAFRLHVTHNKVEL